jgi:hypothetical protein
VEAICSKLNQSDQPFDFLHSLEALSRYTADIPSRGIALFELEENVLWLHGPNWFKNNEIPHSELD